MVNGVKNEVLLRANVSAPSIDIKVNTIASNGKPLTVVFSTGSLKNNAILKSYIIDPLTGQYILVDVPAVKFNKNTGLTTEGLTGGFEYHFISEKEAKKIENSIYNSIKLSSGFEKTVPATAGSVLAMGNALSPTLNAMNVSRIEYSVSGRKAVIDQNTGLLAINSDAKKGTITVSIKVTLKNGKTKTIKSKIKIS